MTDHNKTWVTIHPKEFSLFQGLIFYKPLPAESVQIRWDAVESVTHLKGENLVVLDMASGEKHGITEEEFQEINLK